MAATATATGCLYYGGAPSRFRHNANSVAVAPGKLRRGRVAVRCESSESGIGARIQDFIGGDLLKLDLGRWLSDVEEHKAIAIYPPHEGGYEGRYLTRLRYQGYYFLDLSARGLGDPETTLLKVHPVCPAHLGKQPIARWYFPPEVDFRLNALPPNAKGLVVYVMEAKVLSKAELQFLALLPTLRPKVRVIAECGNWRKFMWRPLKEVAGLTDEGA
uniref:NADH dehydrogenase-like complex N n=1 Tax=California macrophylla TaxID=337344 RepID=A0A0F7H001_9ROSI